MFFSSDKFIIFERSLPRTPSPHPLKEIESKSEISFMEAVNEDPVIVISIDDEASGSGILIINEELRYKKT